MSTSFQAILSYPDTVPANAGSYSIADVQLSTAQYYTFTPSQYNSPVSWYTNGGNASIAGTGYTSSGTISPGQNVQLQLVSSGSYSTQNSMTFYMGNTLVFIFYATTIPNPVGQVLYTGPGTYYWTCPSNVTSISVVCIGTGATGMFLQDGLGYYYGGGGGGLAYGNNIAVTPTQAYVIDINTNQRSSFAGLVSAADGNGNAGGSYSGGNGGGVGGNGGPYNSTYGTSGGGGGAGGYIGGGGTGGYVNGSGTGIDGTAPVSGSGGGGGGGWAYVQGQPGGGTGVYGLGADGGVGYYNTAGSAGSGGFGALYGGGAAGRTSSGGLGAVRIIWPGSLRQFPSTRTADE